MSPSSCTEVTVRLVSKAVSAAVVAAGALLCCGPVEAAEGGASPLGMSIRVRLPIDSDVVERVKRFTTRAVQRAEQQQREPVLILQFETPEEQEEFAQTTDPMDALKLARIIQELGNARTVAYAQESIPGHAVLVAIACDEIMMPDDALLGPVGAEPGKIRPAERGAYTEIAERRRTIPPVVALWLLDPSLDVLKVQTLEEGTEFLTREEFDQRNLAATPRRLSELVEMPGRFTGEEARGLGFVSHLPETPADVADKLELPRGAMNEDPSLVGNWRAVRVDLNGRITSEMVRQAQDLIDESVRRDEANFICVWIDSGGGSLDDSRQLAQTLAALDPNEVRTVAYVPSKARADAALVALACQHVLIHPQAELGGSGEQPFSKEQIEYIGRTIRNDDGPWRNRKQSWPLIEAMIDPHLEVFPCIEKRTGETRYFSGEEKAGLDTEQWEIGRPITTPGKALLLDGDQAVEYGLADRTINNLAELKDIYYLEDIQALETGWADFLIAALSRPEVSAVLLTIAFVALYVELSAPGIGLGGFVATVCFLLFFWAHYLGGTAGWLEAILFAAGVACLLLEVFVLPGFGVFGLGGIGLVLVSLVLASQTFVLPQNEYQLGQLTRSLMMLGGTVVGIIAGALVLRRWLPGTPIFTTLLLQPPEGEEAVSLSQREALVHFEGFVGMRGRTTTQLTPGGKARFGDTLVDVITDGDVIPRGTEVEVVEVHGNRVVVKAIQE